MLEHEYTCPRLRPFAAQISDHFQITSCRAVTLWPLELSWTSLGSLNYFRRGQMIQRRQLDGRDDWLRVQDEIPTKWRDRGISYQTNPDLQQLQIYGPQGIVRRLQLEAL
ncbi:hypothetical protein O988_04113 [Pseudogymnoascus sp. VKM F-3808]|nr:hypothetical protein O988_04113 [Pseudogymnoascus sp. VKM F-3808]